MKNYDNNIFAVNYGLKKIQYSVNIESADEIK